jgi:hypothetical protein
MKDDRFYRSFRISAGEPGSLELTGRPIVFEKTALIQGYDSRGQVRRFYEIIDRHALDRTDMKDVPLRAEHDTKTIYARTRNKSLILDIKPDGLYMTASLLDNEKGRTLHEEVRTGLIPMMSFAFPLDSKVVNDGTHKGLPLRRVMDIPQLLDVSVAAYGAYGTEAFVNARSFDWMVEQARGVVESDRRIYSMKLQITEALQKTSALLKGEYYE